MDLTVPTSLFIVKDQTDLSVHEIGGGRRQHVVVAGRDEEPRLSTGDASRGTCCLT
jgi:hypothetical protein